jgi:hypothetical protein
MALGGLTYGAAGGYLACSGRLAAGAEGGSASASKECKPDEGKDEHAAETGAGDGSAGSQQGRALGRLERHEAPLAL